MLRVAVCAIIAVSLIACTKPLMAQSARMELSIAAGSAEVSKNAKVPILFNSPVGIGASQFELVYDPAVLRFVGVENGPLLPSALVESNEGQAGRARVAFVSNDEVKGSGELLIAEFEVLKGLAATTTIGLESVRGWDQVNNLPVIVAAQSGDWKLTTIENVPSGKLAQDPEPGNVGWIYGLGAAVVVVIVLSLFRRSKR